jgi:hypothetical protein
MYSQETPLSPDGLPVVGVCFGAPTVSPRAALRTAAVGHVTLTGPAVAVGAVVGADVGAEVAGPLETGGVDEPPQATSANPVSEIARTGMAERRFCMAEVYPQTIAIDALGFSKRPRHQS